MLGKDLLSQWFKAKRPTWLYVAILVNGGLIFYTTHVTFQGFPYSPDEYSYQISAGLFSTGRLSVPSPEPRAFFDTANIVNNGIYYGKYPPGWPLLLAVGKILNLEWWVNPFLSLLTLALLFVMARNLVSPQVANIAMALTLFCPYFIFNSACLMSHPSGLLFLTLAAYFLIGAELNLESAVGLGMASGFAFLIRPFTAVLVLAPLLLYFLSTALHRGDRLYVKNLLICTVCSFSFSCSLAFTALFWSTNDLLRESIKPFSRTLFQ